MTETMNKFTDETINNEAKERLRRLLREGGIPSEAFAHAEAVDGAEVPNDPFANMQAALLLKAEESLLADKTYLGNFYGSGSSKTGQYFMLANDASGNGANFMKLGRIVSADEYHALMDDPAATLNGCLMFGAYVDDCWIFRMLDEDRSYLNLLPYGLVTQLFSRNMGLFETDAMMGKTAIIVGQGSAGSMAALYLARSGVGRFILVDGDILDIHNLSRHQLDGRFLGHYKVDAMREAILAINPKAQVEVFCGYLQDAPMELFSQVKDGIVIGTADDRSANALANELAKNLGIPFTAVGGWTRCHAGETFYWIPNRGLPTYAEGFSGLIAEPETASKADKALYFADAHDMEKLNFEPGTAVDLGFITMVNLKFDLDLINLNNSNYTPRVLNDYTHYTIICNTNDPKIGGENAAMFPHPLYISRNVTLSAEDRGV